MLALACQQLLPRDTLQILRQKKKASAKEGNETEFQGRGIYSGLAFLTLHFQ